MTRKPSGYEAQEEKLREIGKRMPPELAAELRQAHDELGWGCGAQAEDGRCCVDLMLGPAEVKVFAQAAAAVGGAGIEGI